MNVAEVFPPGDFIYEELKARGWTIRQLARRMGGDIGVNELSISLLIQCPTRGLLIGEETAEKLGQAFDVSPEFFLNLDKAWQEG